jgi:predicted DNA-binding transcriptional regulator YafY
MSKTKGAGMSKTKGAGMSKTARKEPTRKSTRQQVLANSVPVSKRTTQRLIKAFDLAGPSKPVGEQAMEAYIKSYEAPMTEQRIKAVRMLTSLDSGPVLAASTQLAAEQELTGAEEVAV